MSGFSDLQVDEDTLAAARGGDPRAQEGIYRSFSGPVYNLALRLLGKRVQAEEVLQDTFVEILSKLDEYRGESPLGFWIRRITLNKCLMFIRSPWYSRSTPLAAMEDGLPADAYSPDRDSNADALINQMALERALACLSQTSRMVVWLHDVEGYTHTEIAAHLGKTNSFSKTRLARAHSQLQALLDDRSITEPCMQLLNNY